MSRAKTPVKHHRAAPREEEPPRMELRPMTTRAMTPEDYAYAQRLIERRHKYTGGLTHEHNQEKRTAAQTNHQL